MSRVAWIDHHGVRILRIDFSKLDAAGQRNVIAEAGPVIWAESQHSVLTLTDVSGASIDKASVTAMQEYISKNKPFVKAAAVVGASGLHRAILNTSTMITRRELRAFASEDEARTWLAKSRP